MYLLKHICIGVISVINQLIAALVPTTTSACLSSFTPGASITAKNGFTNAALTYFNIANNNRPLALLCVCLPNGVSAQNVL